MRDQEMLVCPRIFRRFNECLNPIPLFGFGIGVTGIMIVSGIIGFAGKTEKHLAFKLIAASCLVLLCGCLFLMCKQQRAIVEENVAANN